MFDRSPKPLVSLMQSFVPSFVTFLSCYGELKPFAVLKSVLPLLLLRKLAGIQQNRTLFC